MYKNIARIDGMMCGMCEAHISDTIRKTFPDAKKVSASHTKGVAQFLTESEASAEKLSEAIKQTGYDFVSLDSKPYEKKGFFSKLKK